MKRPVILVIVIAVGSSGCARTKELEQQVKDLGATNASLSADNSRLQQEVQTLTSRAALLTRQLAAALKTAAIINALTLELEIEDQTVASVTEIAAGVSIWVQVVGGQMIQFTNPDLQIEVADAEGRRLLRLRLEPVRSADVIGRSIDWLAELQVVVYRIDSVLNAVSAPSLTADGMCRLKLFANGVLVASVQEGVNSERQMNLTGHAATFADNYYRAVTEQSR